MKKNMLLVLCIVILVAFTIVACGGNESAQNDDATISEGQENNGKAASDYPAKPITLIVPYGAGGGTDVTARLLSEPLSKALGQPVVVTNVVGGGGWNGWGQLANSEPDGYTIGYVNIPNVFAGYLDPQMDNDESIDSFTMIMNHVTDPGMYAVSVDSEFETMQDLVDYALEHPGEVSITAHGHGGDDFLGIQQLQKSTGAEFKIIHNNSTAESKTQILGGHVDVLCANVSEVIGLVNDGELRVLGVAYDERSEFLPDVPTLKEQGIDAVHFAARGIAAPADTPAEIIEIISESLKEATSNPEHVKQCQELGLSLIPMEGDEYTTFIKSWEAKIKDLMGW